MAPIKLEEHIKERLEKRRIQPSKGSWDKLNARLDNDFSSKKSGSKWWLSVAVAVAIILIAGIFFIDQQKEETLPIVETPVEKVPETKVQKEAFEDPVQLASKESISEKKEPEIETPVTKRNKMVPAKMSDSDGEKELIVETFKEDEELIGKIALAPSENIEIKTDKINDKIHELLAKVSEKEKENGSVTDAEVDALLARAAKQLSDDRDFYSRGKVDPNALLADVESELDQSFRREVFEVLKEKFLKAKTAIATRND